MNRLQKLILPLPPLNEKLPSVVEGVAAGSTPVNETKAGAAGGDEVSETGSSGKYSENEIGDTATDANASEATFSLARSTGA